jgi:hypothetical protein
MDTTEIVNQLKQKREELFKTIKSLDETIALFLKDNSDVTVNSVALPSDKSKSESASNTASKVGTSLKTVILNVFKAENRFLHIREINPLVAEKAPEFKDQIDKIRSTISNLKTQNVLIPYKVGSSNLNTFWGSKNWLNEKGEPKAEHSYNEEYVSGYSSEVIDL